MIKGFLGKKRAEVWPEYKRTIEKLFSDELSDEPVVLEQAIQFAKERKFRRALVSAENDINNSNYDAAIKRFDTLKSFGVERDLGIEYWANPTDPARWRIDRQGAIGTFFLPKLDKMMNGGLGAGELGLIFAGGKIGKSSLLGRFAAGALWQNKNVAIATGELSAEKYRKRIDAMITGRSSRELTNLSYWMNSKRKELSKHNREALEDTLERMRLMHNQMKGRLFIKQWPTNKGKIRDVESWLDQLKEDKDIGIDILFVDYVRVFKPNQSHEEHRMNIGQVSLDLRGIAVERKMPVWSAQQITRSALNKERFDPSDIAEDISQFWTLDFGIAFCQTEQEAKAGKFEKGKEIKPEKGRIYLMTARDVGKGGMVDVRIWRDTFRISQADMREI